MEIEKIDKSNMKTVYCLSKDGIVFKGKLYLVVPHFTTEKWHVILDGDDAPTVWDKFEVFNSERDALLHSYIFRGEGRD